MLGQQMQKGEPVLQVPVVYPTGSFSGLTECTTIPSTLEAVWHLVAEMGSVLTLC